MSEKRYSHIQKKKVTKNELIEGKDWVEDWYSAADVTDKKWSLKNIKSLLKDFINTKLIYQVTQSDQVILERIMLANKINKIESKKWKNFFKNLQPAALDKEGIKEIIEFANSDSNTKIPPDLTKYGEEISQSEREGEDPEIKIATTDEVESNSSNKPIFENYELDTVENIFSNTEIEKSKVISLDKEAIDFLLNYWIHKLWNRAFKKESDTINKINKEKLMEINFMIRFFRHLKKNMKM